MSLRVADPVLLEAARSADFGPRRVDRSARSFVRGVMCVARIAWESFSVAVDARSNDVSEHAFSGGRDAVHSSAQRLLHATNIMRAAFDADPLHRDSCSEEANDTVPPSQRLTFEMAAVASVAGYTDTRGNVPLQACVPIRTSAEPPATITGEQMYVLLYVDGLASLAEIAEETSFSLSETIAIVLGLVTQGLVAFDDDAALQSQRIPKTPR
jgi:hypothetical protein